MVSSDSSEFCFSRHDAGVIKNLNLYVIHRKSV